MGYCTLPFALCPLPCALDIAYWILDIGHAGNFSLCGYLLLPSLLPSLYLSTAFAFHPPLAQLKNAANPAPGF